MNIDTKKFNLELPCNLEPFGYIEETMVVDTKSCGEIMLVAFGALNYLGHYAPEFGGVALVCLDPDLFIAVKYIPWDAPGRLAELQYQISYLLENHENMAPQDISCYFYIECDYVLPARKERYKEEYFLMVAEENKARAEELKKQNERLNKLQKKAMAGKRVAKLNKSIKPRTPEEIRNEQKEKEMTSEQEQYVKPKLKLVKKEESVPEKKKIKMVDGEELIPLDEEE